MPQSGTRAKRRQAAPIRNVTSWLPAPRRQKALRCDAAAGQGAGNQANYRRRPPPRHTPRLLRLVGANEWQTAACRRSILPAAAATSPAAPRVTRPQGRVQAYPQGRSPPAVSRRIHLACNQRRGRNNDKITASRCVLPLYVPHSGTDLNTPLRRRQRMRRGGVGGVCITDGPVSGTGSCPVRARCGHAAHSGSAHGSRTITSRAQERRRKTRPQSHAIIRDRAKR